MRHLRLATPIRNRVAAEAIESLPKQQRERKPPPNVVRPRCGYSAAELQLVRIEENPV